MLNLRKSSILVVAACLVFSVVSAYAADWGLSPIEPNRYVVNDNYHPLAAKSLTQSNDPATIVSGTSVACVGAGTTDTGEGVVTSGGRVLSVTAWQSDLPVALKRAYDGIGKVHFAGAHWRKDIGRRAL